MIDKAVLLFLSLFAIGAKGNAWVLSDVFLIASIIYVGYLQFSRGAKIPTLLLGFSVAWLLISTLYLASFGWLNVTSTVRAYLKIALAILIVHQLGEKMLRLYCRTMVVAVKISLVFYIGQLIVPDALKAVIFFIDHNLPSYNYKGQHYGNIFIYTLNLAGGIESFKRNSGMAWEPKAFSNMIIVALFLNIYFYKGRLNKDLVFMLLALLTTLSTVGYGVLVAFVIPFYMTFQKKLYLPITLTCYTLILFLVLGQSFMLEKIKYEISRADDIKLYVDQETDYKARSLGRFGSLEIDYNDFKRRPLLGVGMQEEERTQGVYSHLVRVNGLSDLLSRFGVVGIIFYLVAWWMTAFRIFGHSYFRGLLFLFAVFGITFATNIILNPLWLAFMFYGLVAGVKYKPIGQPI